MRRRMIDTNERIQKKMWQTKVTLCSVANGLCVCVCSRPSTRHNCRKTTKEKEKDGRKKGKKMTSSSPHVILMFARQHTSIRKLFSFSFIYLSSFGRSNFACLLLCACFVGQNIAWNVVEDAHIIGSMTSLPISCRFALARSQRSRPLVTRARLRVCVCVRVCSYEWRACAENRVISFLFE